MILSSLKLALIQSGVLGEKGGPFSGSQCRRAPCSHCCPQLSSAPVSEASSQERGPGCPIERSQQASPAGSVRRVFWTRSVHFKPRVYATFVINAQAGQPGYRVPLKQLLQADHTLTRVFSQHVIVVGETRFAQTHYKVHFHLIRSHGLGANGALETTVRAEPPGCDVQR